MKPLATNCAFNLSSVLSALYFGVNTYLQLTNLLPPGLLIISYVPFFFQSSYFLYNCVFIFWYSQYLLNVVRNNNFIQISDESSVTWVEPCRIHVSELNAKYKIEVVSGGQ